MLSALAFFAAGIFAAGIFATLFVQHRWEAAARRARLLPPLQDDTEGLRRAVFASQHIRREGRVIVSEVLARRNG